MREGFVPWPDEVARRYRDAGYWRADHSVTTCMSGPTCMATGKP